MHFDEPLDLGHWGENALMLRSLIDDRDAARKNTAKVVRILVTRCPDSFPLAPICIDNLAPAAAAGNADVLRALLSAVTGVRRGDIPYDNTSVY